MWLATGLRIIAIGFLVIAAILGWIKPRSHHRLKATLALAAALLFVILLLRDVIVLF